MNNLKKILGLGLSAALLMSALAGCGDGKKPAASATPGATPGTTATPGATPGSEAPIVATEDMVQQLVGIPADTVMFTVDGENVTAQELYYWIATAVDSVGYYNFGSADAIDWTQEQDGQTIAQFILADAKQTAQFYRIMETEAAKNGVTLTQEQSDELKTQTASNIAQYGEEEYAKQLQQMMLSDEAFRHMVEVSYLGNGIQDLLYGENGKTPMTAEALTALAEEKSLLAAKHILIAFNAAGTEVTDEEKAAAKEKADGILTQLKAVSGDEQVKLFDTLMNENSEDGRDTSNNLYSANGYIFGTGEMVQAFEDATKALQPGQVSDLVETDYGYHIILRLAPDNGSLLYSSQQTTFGDYWVGMKMKETTDEWLTASKVEDAPEMANVDVQGFYTKLSAYRASLVPEETPAPTETAAPSAAPTETATPSPSAGS